MRGSRMRMRMGMWWVVVRLSRRGKGETIASVQIYRFDFTS